jgi:hypothetical protein
MTETTQTVVTARPQYIQDMDLALLGKIFGEPDADGVLQGGILDANEFPNLFQIPDYVQAEVDPLQSAVTSTLGDATQRQAFMDRYLPYFQDASGTPRYLPDAGSALSTGQATMAKALTNYFPDAKSALEAGRGSVDAGGQFGAKDAFDRRTGRAFELAEQGLGSFDPSSVDDFMDPYKQQVIDAAMKKITREGAQQRQADAARAIGAGAFGGSRSGIQAAETQRAIEETKQGTIANLLSKGYDKSMANAMATDEAERKRALQASGLTGRLGASGASLESSAFEDAAKRGLGAAENEKKRDLEAGRLTGGLGQTYGQLGGAQADVGQAYGKLAGTSADIGRVYAGMQPADLGFMYELGGKERQYGQQAEDFARQNTLNYTQQALAPLSYAQNFVTGSPSASMYSQYTQGPQTSADPFLQGVGAYSTMQGFSG